MDWVPRAACPHVFSGVFWIALAGKLPVAPFFNGLLTAYYPFLTIIEQDFLRKSLDYLRWFPILDSIH